MNYEWNIRSWVRQELPGLKRHAKRTSIIVALLANIKQATGTAETLYKQFTDFMEYCRLRTRYNCQQGSLQALLNKVFDPDYKRIYLVTSSDVLVTTYGRLQGDSDAIPITYGKLAGEAIPTTYGYLAADYVNAFDGAVHVPVELQPREAEIKKWIDLNIFLSKTYKIYYF